MTTGALLVFDHKTLLALATFVVIGSLLLVHLRTAVGGRAAARLVLVAYLLLSGRQVRDRRPRRLNGRPRPGRLPGETARGDCPGRLIEVAPRPAPTLRLPKY